MDGHRSFSCSGALKTDVVFKIFAYDLKDLEVFLRKVLYFLLLRFVLLSHLADLVLKLTYRKIIFDHEVAEVFLDVGVFHSEKYLGVSY